jgi:hypothetical protein
MAKKSGNFLEQNIDKIVLALVGVVCLAILVLMVVRSPNTMTVDRKSYGPAEIDQAVSYKTSALTEKLSGAVQPRAYASKFNEFKSAYAVAVTVPQDIRFPIPAPVAGGARAFVGPYKEPKMPQLGKPVIGVISGVADVPVGPTIDSGTEPGDVDLVTVQCTFNPSVLYKEMQAGFANEADLQNPVFAVVELQRQEMNEDGTWPADAWLTVKRIKADRYSDILDVEQMKSKPVSEAESLRAQLITVAIAIDVLQPDGYVFRSRPDRWLPPELEEKRQKLKEKMNRPGSLPEGTVAPTPTPKKTSSTVHQPGTGGLGAVGEAGTGRSTRPGAAPRPQPTPPTPRPGQGGSGLKPGPGTSTGDSGPLTPETELDALRKAIANMDNKQQQATLWAHDDSTQPGKTYRYRLRLGLLNPIAGRGRSTTDPALADKLLFWSEFSAVTQPVEISARMYLFANKYNETNGAVTIEVAKYQMARWETKSYDVRPGEMIGRLEKMQPAVDSTGNSIPLPDVDFTTSMTVVDVETITEYRPGAATSLTYQQVLYKGQDNVIRNLAVKMSTWPKSLRKKFTDIEAAVNAQPSVPVSYIGTGSTYTVPTESSPAPSVGSGSRE